MNNTHVKQFTEKKPQRFICIQQVLQKYNQALELCSRAAFEEVMPRRQKNTWPFQVPDSSPCSLCCSVWYQPTLYSVVVLPHSLQP